MINIDKLFFYLFWGYNSGYIRGIKMLWLDPAGGSTTRKLVVLRDGWGNCMFFLTHTHTHGNSWLVYIFAAWRVEQSGHFFDVQLTVETPWVCLKGKAQPWLQSGSCGFVETLARYHKLWSLKIGKLMTHHEISVPYFQTSCVKRIFDWPGFPVYAMPVGGSDCWSGGFNKSWLSPRLPVNP